MPEEPAIAPDLGEHWTRAVELLSPGARMWAGNATPLSLHDDILIVAVRDELSRAQLESRVRPILEQQLSDSLGAAIRLIVTIDPDKVADVFIDLSTNREIDPVSAPSSLGAVDLDDPHIYLPRCHRLAMN